MIPSLYITGERRCGKSTAARALYEAFGLQEVSITTPLYEVARTYFGMAEKDRALLQKVGDAFRNVREDWLIEHVIEQAKSAGGMAVCPDIRLPREGEVLRAHGWIGLRIERTREHQSAAILEAGEELTGEQAEHQTETQVRLVPVDGWINNNGTPEELGEKAVAMVKAILRAREDHAWLHMRPVGREILPPYEIDEP